MGKRIALTNGRRLVDDVIRMANKTPLASISGEWDLREVAQLRRMAETGLRFVSVGAFV